MRRWSKKGDGETWTLEELGKLILIVLAIIAAGGIIYFLATNMDSAWDFISNWMGGR